MLILAVSLLLVQQAPEETIDWDKEFGVEERVRDPETGEFPVDPYVQDNANAGAAPFSGTRMAEAFGGKDGIRHIARRTVDLAEADPRIADIFVSHDTTRSKRAIYEMFCYILNAGCDYTGRDMKTTHEELGLRMADLNALVENLQKAMREQDVPFAAQNRLLAKLAPMSADVLER